MEPQETTPPPETQETMVSKSGPNLKLIAIISAVVLIVIIAFIGILAGLSMLRRPLPVTPLPTPVPTPIPSEIEVIQKANPKYASDSALLDLKNNLKELSKQIGMANFFEPELSSPNIDLKIEIR